MLIKESQLSFNCNDVLDMLNEVTYLTQEESMLSLEEIPVVCKESGYNLVDYEYISKVAEDNGCSLFEAVSLLKEHNSLDNLVISIDEGDAIVESNIFNTDTMVIRPITENNREYVYAMSLCESLYNGEMNVDAFDEAMLSLDEEKSYKELRKDHLARANELLDKNWSKLIDDRNKEWEANREQGKKDNDWNAARTRSNEIYGKYKKMMDNEHDLYDQRILKNKRDDNKENKLYSLRQIASERKEEEDRAAADDEKLLSRAATFSKPDSNGEVKKASADTRMVMKINQANNDLGKGIGTKKNGLMTNNDLSDAVTNPNNKQEAKSRLNSLLGKHNDTTNNVANGENNADVPKANVTDSTQKPNSSGNMKKYGAAALGGAALAGGAWYAYKKYKTQPKSVIGKRIAALRQIYAKFMKKAQSSKDSGVAARLKKVAAHVLQVIDKLLGYLQNKAG